MPHEIGGRTFASLQHLGQAQRDRRVEIRARHRGRSPNGRIGVVIDHTGDEERVALHREPRVLQTRCQGQPRGHCRPALTDLVILGGGLGGVATALAACRNGLQVILTEETDWIGGQLTQQAVPPDEQRFSRRGIEDNDDAG